MKDTELISFKNYWFQQDGANMDLPCFWGFWHIINNKICSNLRWKKKQGE